MALYPLQAQLFSLNGAGAVIGDTSVVLKTFKKIDGSNITMSDLGAIAYMTLEPGNSTLEEQISFTGVTQNTNGTATLTGVKTVLFEAPYTQTSGLAKTHAGSTTAVLTNTSGYYSEFGVKQNNETITGQWTVPTPLSNGAIANKLYVDSLVNGGIVTTNAVTVAGTAGENVTAGNFVYLSTSDGKWYKTDADSASTTNLIQIGIVQSTTTANNPIVSGVMIKGIDTNQSGLVAGTLYYLSNTAGGISSSTGTTERVIGQGYSATSIILDPDFYYIPIATQKAAMQGGSAFGTPSSTNKFLTETYLTGFIQMYGGSSAPTGWLLCDGSAVSRTTYANLFAITGTAYGAGDTTTTFNLPDLRSRVPVGAGTGIKVFTFASRSSDTITVTAPTNSSTNEIQTGQIVNYVSSGSVMTGLTSGNDYYLIRIAYNQFRLASSLTNAQNGTQISLSSDGTGTQTFTLTLTARSRGDTGGEETHAMSITELLAHTHSVPAVGTTDNNTGATNGIDRSVDPTSGSTGGNAAMNNMQPFGVVSYIIKT